MRCYNCHKNFDYDKYYGICPKCGSFNRRETQEEHHENLHERFGDESVHREEKKTFVRAEERKQKSGGPGFIIISVLVFILGIAVLASGAAVMLGSREVSSSEADHTLRLEAHEAGESFAFQQAALQVLEAKVLADRDTLPGLEKGMKLVAVHVAGQGDGEFEDYNRIQEPYLETDGAYRYALSAHEFEPYGQMLGARPALDGWALSGETSCDGWYGFVVEEEAQQVRIWFDEYDWSDWDGGNLLAAHYVDLQLEEPETGAEGGETDAE